MPPTVVEVVGSCCSIGGYLLAGLVLAMQSKKMEATPWPLTKELGSPPYIVLPVSCSG